jgi:hypothetical protein
MTDATPMMGDGRDHQDCKATRGAPLSDNIINELDTPTNARAMPTKVIGRWNGFSATNAFKAKAKLAYIRLNIPTACLPRAAVPVNTGAWFREFVPPQHAQFVFGQGCDRSSYVAGEHCQARTVAASCKIVRTLASRYADSSEANCRIKCAVSLSGSAPQARQTQKNSTTSSWRSPNSNRPTKLRSRFSLNFSNSDSKHAFPDAAGVMTYLHGQRMSNRAWDSGEKKWSLRQEKTVFMKPIPPSDATANSRNLNVFKELLRRKSLSERLSPILSELFCITRGHGKGRALPNYCSNILRALQKKHFRALPGSDSFGPRGDNGSIGAMEALGPYFNN